MQRKHIDPNWLLSEIEHDLGCFQIDLKKVKPEDLNVRLMDVVRMIKEAPAADVVPREDYQRVVSENERLANAMLRISAEDDPAMQRRTFHLEYSQLLNPEEAMDAFVTQVRKILNREG